MKVGTSFYLKNKNLRYFALLLNNIIIVALHYLKTIITFKNFCEKKTFNQTIRFVFEELSKIEDPYNQWTLTPGLN